MTVTVKNLVPAKQVEIAQTTQYTASNCKALIDKCTITNNAASNVLFSANLVPEGGTPANGNLVINERAIAPKETYVCPELVGQVLEEGGFLSAIASVGSALTIVVSGREIT